MTIAAAIERLRSHGYTEEQARAMADLLEEWEASRVVTREFLRSELRGLEVRLVKFGFQLTVGAAGLILTGVYFLLAHFKP